MSSVDKANADALEQLAGPEAASIACILREMSEELGLVPDADGVSSVPNHARLAIVEDKHQWLPLATSGVVPVNRTRIRTLSHRITPPFGPVQDNAFLHLHVGDWQRVPDIDLNLKRNSPKCFGHGPWTSSLGGKRMRSKSLLQSLPC